MGEKVTVDQVVGSIPTRATKFNNMKKELEELQPNRLFANRDTLEEAFKNGMDMCERMTDGQSIFGITALMVVWNTLADHYEITKKDTN